MEIYYKCIEDFRDRSNRIVEHKIGRYVNNNICTGTMVLSHTALKRLIKEHKIKIINMKVTSDNRLIRIKESEINNNLHRDYILLDKEFIRYIDDYLNLSFQSNKNIDTITKKAKSTGMNVEAISPEIVILRGYNKICVVSNKQIRLDGYKELNGRISGDEGGLFEDSKFISIDCTNTDTSHVTDMTSMFSKCNAKRINLDGLDTYNVENMQEMFKGVKLNYLSLGSINTHKVTNMAGMFNAITISELDLRKLDVSNAINMQRMFGYCHIDKLDLSNINTVNVQSMASMFEGSEINGLNISGLNTSNVASMQYMFMHSKIKDIDLSSFNVSKVKNMVMMFTHSQAERINLSSFKLRKGVDYTGMFIGCRAKIEGEIVSIRLSKI